MPRAHRLQNRAARPADRRPDEVSGPCVAGYQLSLDDEGLPVGLQITRGEPGGTGRPEGTTEQ